MHQLQGNKEYGSEKKGYILKKSDGLRKVWQRRKCMVKNGILTISHATVSLLYRMSILQIYTKNNNNVA
ncbi:hypothetical protein GDO81_023459 [Engystomops pustulosus]|uniref:Uncharacterized protein n=1 Tax=Engystomops pustulosus TaxID=76066 RepID=A0AAV6YVK0_ENGPU|nr:hypothetical protein GDO81_023459 [Engystomops pustulosus]